MLLALVACGSPPKPPKVDPGSRHPANTAAAVELQVCKSELNNTHILAAQSDQISESTSATLAYLIAQQRALLTWRETRSAPSLPATVNSVYTVRFDFGSAQVDIPERVALTLVAQARTAALVMLRARTDGTRDSASESRIARERASAVRSYLIAGGVDPSRVRATYQPVGDQVADNDDPAGRSLNRRVEIELYPVLPVPLEANAARL